ncbi:MAG: Mur ligase family protein [Candidatus Moduliflexus flocculans]|nr:Mur ligase family protein [Candidatus Moduliflexus flocculans]
MPLCMTGPEENTGAMVLEMGTSRPGDVDELCRIASPDAAVITNIGYEHREGFGSIEGVRRGRSHRDPALCEAPDRECR